jgi:LysR family transcriptional regulator, glycine cleavage system transcriptional activator
MNWNLPSLAALRILEASARHGSFTRAARELHITQSAVSRQIRLLEESLNVRLFERTQQRITLTPAGAEYLDKIRGPLDQLQKATLELVTGESSAGVLNVATPPAFGMRWLVPRLPRFQRLHPEIVISLVTRNAVFDFSTEEIDAAFHYGNDDWPNVASMLLTGDKLVLVAARSYLGRIAPIRCPADVVNAVKLQPIRRPNLWRDWLAAANVDEPNPWAGPRFEHYYLIVEAAVAGLGLAILPHVIVADELELGRLLNPLDVEFDSTDCYSLVYPPSNENDVKLRAFRNWLKTESAGP